MTDYIIATACDSSRARYALNLIASIQLRSPIFQEIQVYDLGLTRFQRRQFENCEGVKLIRVPAFCPHWNQAWTWKPWIWMNTGHDKVIFLDAGTEVLRDLTEMCDLVDRDGYFTVSQLETLPDGCTLGVITPKDYFKKFGVKPARQSEPVVAAGIIGFDTASDFYKQVVRPTYQACIRGYNLGWSEHELWRNTGINQQNPPIIRDCAYFRHDQTLLNLMLYKYSSKPTIQPVEKFGGFHSPHDHPEQLIWNSRAHNPLLLIDKLSYKRHSGARNRMNRLHLSWTDSWVSKFSGRVRRKLQRIMKATS
jgi:hypothetical protein